MARLDNERWTQVRNVFDAAADIPPSERMSFVDGMCGDDVRLRSQVAHLLTAHDRIGESFLDYPVVRTAVTLADDDPCDANTSPPSHPAGSRVSHYRIESFIGAGGMGSVYRAHDIALGRPAALKMLPATFSPMLQKRLRDEAEACAHLQHPYIATYFESGGSAEGSFIAMELVDGETMRALLRRGPLPVAQAAAIACCLLEALSHAHSVHLLHRDIKPENVMITGPASAKLLDFGLAQHFVPDPSTDALTEDMPSGAVAGTIGYMSPEQIINGHLDGRSDLFQVGAVLYEALAGVPAFPGATIVERLAAVLTRDPDPLPAQVPASISAIVFRALQREPSRRYPSAAAFLLDLRASVSGEWVSGVEPTIAVLDFINTASEPSLAWIATGMTETLNAEFGRIEGLRVISRDRVHAASLNATDASDERRAAVVGQRLSCRSILWGRYTQLGETIHVAATLLEPATERVVSEMTFAGPLAQILDIQDRLVSAVVEALGLTRGPRSSATVAPDMSAYELYARGRRLFLRLEKGSLDQASAYYERAIAAEPQYALALSGLAGFHAMRFTYTTDRQALDRAADLARRAVAADAHSADARNWLGYVLFRRGELDLAARELAHARHLQPDWFFPYYFGGLVAHLRRDTTDAIGLLQLAAVLEPRQSYPMLGLACIQTDLGRFDEALWCFERAAVIESNHRGAAQWPGLKGFHAECLRRLGRLDDARALCMAAIEDVERSDHMYRDSNRVFCLVTLGRIALQQGDRDAARAALRQALAHVRGRERTLAGGWFAVQALAGLARADHERHFYDEAVTLNATRDRFDFSWLYFCYDVTWLDLSQAAESLGLHDDAVTMRARAAAEGWLESTRT